MTPLPASCPVRHRTTAIFALLVAVATPALAQSGGALNALARNSEGRSKAITSSSPDFNSNWDRRTYIQPGETMVLAEIFGPGIINHIWLTFNDAAPNWLEADGSAAPHEIVLRMTWDNADHPAVEAPLGDFFAAGFGLRREVRSIPIQVEGGDGYNSFWQMPFASRALITVTNESEKRVRSFYYQIDYTELDDRPYDLVYFNARYNQAFPERLGEDYLVLETAGRGHYVGTVMSVQSRSPSWFGEGDARIYIDGDERPTIQGTGTEDYFLSAWGLDEHSWPYFGCTYLSDDPSNLGMRATMYRWHIDDPIRFSESIRVTFEHTGWISADETETGEVDGHVEREDDIATVAFWYQTRPSRSDSTLPPLAERIFPDLDVAVTGTDLLQFANSSAGRMTLQPGYIWTGEGQVFFLPETENAWAQFEFSAPVSGRRGLVLRMTRAPDYGRYRILLDGEPISSLSDYPDWNPTGPIDFYGPTVDTRDLYLGTYDLAPGPHTLRFEGAGRSTASTDNFLGLDSIRFRERWDRKRPSLRGDDY